MIAGLNQGRIHETLSDPSEVACLRTLDQSVPKRTALADRWGTNTEVLWIASRLPARSLSSPGPVEGSAPASPAASPRPGPSSRWWLALNPTSTPSSRRSAAAGGRALALTADVKDLDSLPGVIESTVEQFGGLDILVNNAGGEISPRFLDTRVDHIREAIHFNVLVPFELSRLAVPHLLERPGASILNLSSQTTLVSIRGSLAHHTGKTAESQLTLSMAADLGPRIRVNALLPGPIVTEALQRYWDEKDDSLRDVLAEHTRMKRLGTVDDVANTGDLPQFAGGVLDHRAPHGAHGWNRQRDQARLFPDL